MCLIACAWCVDPRFELVLIANRDELHARESAAAAALADAPWIVGGRDAQAGGSWLQFSSRGRLAAVTNVRSGLANPARPRSRGALVVDFVRGSAPAAQFAEDLADSAAEYGPFNLLLWDGGALQLSTNHQGHAQTALQPGIHVLSNGPFGTPWPKTERVRSGLREWLDDVKAHAGPPDLRPLFALLLDRTQPDDRALPDTGVGLGRERLLAPIFVRDPRYGTRCSTVITCSPDRSWWFEERRFDAHGRQAGVTQLCGA